MLDRIDNFELKYSVDQSLLRLKSNLFLKLGHMASMYLETLLIMEQTFHPCKYNNITTHLQTNRIEMFTAFLKYL